MRQRIYMFVSVWCLQGRSWGIGAIAHRAQHGAGVRLASLTFDDR